MTRLLFASLCRTVLAVSLFHLAASSGTEVQSGESGLLHIIPKPAQIRPGSGTFTVSAGTAIVTPSGDKLLMQPGKTLAGNILESSSMQLRVIEELPGGTGAISI